jgi:predicted TIM-barrel fold metal-dependent hydrolase
MGFVDSHTHIWFKNAADNNILEKTKEVFGSEHVFREYDIKEIIKEMDSSNIEYVVIIAYPSRELFNTKEDFPIRIVNLCREYPDRFAIIGGVEVNKLSLGEVKYWVEKQYESGVSGFKIHPPHMWFKPNDYREEERNLKQLEYLYQFSQDNNLPIIVHTGTSDFPKARNKYGDPIFVDDISVDFPKLNVIMAHAGRPIWVLTAFQLTRIRRNFYIDISSIPIKRLLDYLPRIEEISEKTLYGSDFGDPRIVGLSENLRKFLELPISEESKKNIAEKTPKKLLKPLSANL